MTATGRPYVEATIFLQRALVGMVTPELRGVCVQADPTAVRGRMIYDHEPTEDERELVSEVETEVTAAYPPEVEVVVHAEGLPATTWPALAPEEWWIYRRREPELSGGG